ncbi:GFA family protein, partial [Salmonella enterica]|nr:GFA family protein [Salmonella enterica]
MSSDVYDSLEGGCTCGAVRYVVTASPLIVHCCHCHWCQRETGSAFVINAVIENMHVHLIKGQVTVIDTPSLSGKGQKIARCPKCQIALWSHYSGSSKLTFLRVGTLDHPEHMPPDVHIY